MAFSPNLPPPQHTQWFSVNGGTHSTALPQLTLDNRSHSMGQQEATGNSHVVCGVGGAVNQRVPVHQAVALSSPAASNVLRAHQR